MWVWAPPRNRTGLDTQHTGDLMLISSPYPTPIISSPTTTVYVTPTIATPKTTLHDAFKPKRVGKNEELSHIVLILDESSSMNQFRDKTISSVNEYIASQKLDAEQTGIETTVSLFKFNGHSVVSVFKNKDVSQVANLSRDSYRPSGGTNLYDAIGGVMMQINNEIAEKSKKDRESVILVIVTDGEENQSRTFDNLNIKTMVAKAEAKNWAFMFLGANIDAFSVGSSIGFNSYNTLQYSTSSMGDTMRSASAMTSRMKSAIAEGVSASTAYTDLGFTDAERTAAIRHDE